MVQIGGVKDAQRSTSKRDAADEARARLEETVFFRGRSKSLRVNAQNGVLVVQGSVPSYYLKQLLQTTLRGIEGITRIDNQVDVFWPIE